MELLYKSEKVKSQCTNMKAAAKLFGGNKELAISLLSRVNSLRTAKNIKDITCQKFFRFHNLKNKNNKDFQGCFAIDVKTLKEPWRIILRPLDEDENIFNPCNIDEIADNIKILEIMEVSKHYE